jgi:hypothetical protein
MQTQEEESDEEEEYQEVMDPPKLGDVVDHPASLKTLYYA